jgi:hypothetical protein
VASVVVSCGGEVFDDGVAGLEMPGDVGAWRAHGRHRGHGEGAAAAVGVVVAEQDTAKVGLRSVRARWCATDEK